MRLTLAWLHLLALGVGLGAVWARREALRVRPLAMADVRRALTADAWWGVAALVWLVTGLWRLLAGTEKATAYYMRHGAFHAKMGLFVLVLLLELWPMITLIRWRAALGRDREAWRPDEGAASRVATISTIEAVLVVLMVLTATMMARGGVR